MSQQRQREQPNRALVAVLAGGRARRMGGAKAGVELCRRPLVSYPLRAAARGGLEAVVVAKRHSPLPPLHERVVYEPAQPSHPLCGVLAALRHAPAVLAVGCDMPFLTGDLLAWMADAEGPAVAALDGRPAPLPALYRQADVPALREAVMAGRSLRATLAGLGARMLDESALAAFGQPRRLLFSVNDPNDLRQAAGWLADDGARAARRLEG